MDENKTPLTHRITALAAAYLDNAGFKPVETEVSVYHSWIADLASFIYPTRTEVKKLKLIEKPWGKDFDHNYEELHYTYGCPFTAIVEVKISMSDFKRDLDYKFSGHIWPAHICYPAYPKGLLEPEQIPAGWIGIECSKEGKRLLKVHHSWYRRINNHGVHPMHHPGPGQVTSLIAQVAIRREHRTRYASQRDWIKSYRCEQKQRQKTADINHLIMMISEWMNNEGYWKERELKHMIERECHKNLPSYLDKYLKNLAALRLCVKTTKP